MERLRNTIEWIKFGIKDFGKDEFINDLRGRRFSDSGDIIRLY